ncbi:MULTISPECIES: ArsR/SmtB family transcription factor [Bacillus cereus group]|uniref:ArsR family transcriptional regulator n=2 Tax=Bacillus cereus group TaxID=86661 RepID=R8DFB6_BACCE|nr:MULTISPECIES: helix-turn-helix transcriptional regulator [Bacillus cereus group]EEL71130.1 Transcriptional regulator, ArsR [Bacillus mycoides]EOO22442.1 ArsR family transcriptional regulator [Bacillus cereus HuA3-9]MED1285118.1 helix-turn-helix transcriptional regulator [Bacillus mycoides]QWH28332.1 transcriptional regulator [Bacillus mycoides]TKI26474.1 helix-turn-helix transcriptional regulator [Bacillus mycoides]
MRTLYHPNREEIQFSSVLYALSDQIRLQIVTMLLEKNEQSCGALNIPIAKSTLSHHFKVLRESGVMYTRLEGTQRFISIREEDLNARFPGLLDVVVHATEPY